MFIFKIETHNRKY